MQQVNFKEMPMDKLVAFYNNYSEKPVKRFSDRNAAERRCQNLWEGLKDSSQEKVMKQKADVTRVEMVKSLKLDRTIQCGESKQTWKNAHQMWKENPEWMTSAQQDRLTRQLYEAAKRGEKLIVNINGRDFCLVNVGGA